jgi:hypothetical protein
MLYTQEYIDGVLVDHTNPTDPHEGQTWIETDTPTQIPSELKANLRRPIILHRPIVHGMHVKRRVYLSIIIKGLHPAHIFQCASFNRLLAISFVGYLRQLFILKLSEILRLFPIY